MIGRRVKIYPMEAASAVAQKREHTYEGVIVGQGLFQLNSTNNLSTTLIVELEDGLLVEFPTANAQLIPVAKPKPTPAKPAGNKK
jgi:hypothetical protein